MCFNINDLEDDIAAAPILFTSGGRFNREGTSFLYLGSDINTCVSQLKLEKDKYVVVENLDVLKRLNILI